ERPEAERIEARPATRGDAATHAVTRGGEMGVTPRAVAPLAAVCGQEAARTLEPDRRVTEPAELMGHLVLAVEEGARQRTRPGGQGDVQPVLGEVTAAVPAAYDHVVGARVVERLAGLVGARRAVRSLHARQGAVERATVGPRGVLAGGVAAVPAAGDDVGVAI